MTVPVSEINLQTSQTVVKGSVPAKFVEMTCGQVRIDSLTTNYIIQQVNFKDIRLILENNF
jgi:hypothetical protein